MSSGLHPGIGRIDLAGFAGSQVDHRMREDGHDEHQHEPLEHIAKDKGLHPWLSLQPTLFLYVFSHSLTIPLTPALSH